MDGVQHPYATKGASLPCMIARQVGAERFQILVAHFRGPERGHEAAAAMPHEGGDGLRREIGPLFEPRGQLSLVPQLQGIGSRHLHGERVISAGALWKSTMTSPAARVEHLLTAPHERIYETRVGLERGSLPRRLR